MSVGTAQQPLRAVVCDELRRLVVTGELAPGARLVEESLAARLGVSRNPVREALQTLAGEGFVELLPRRGAVVAQITAAHAEELFDVRMALESLAARSAARNATGAQLEHLRVVLQDARRATESGDLDALAACNTDFHRLVVAASGNGYLRLLVAPMARRTQWLYRMSVASRAPHSWTEHDTLLRAIANHDEEYAAALAAAHVAAARASYRQMTQAAADSGGAGR